MGLSSNVRNFAADQFKATALADLLHSELHSQPARVLVVGCGKGKEAAALAQRFDADVTGIDIAPAFDQEAAHVANLEQGDATRLRFPDHSFDLVYSFHVLEHIPDYRAALREMRRVLRPSGHYMIGTPNRSRLIGYIGSGVPLATKLRWNMVDWSMQVRGRFRNEFGAHAGYTLNELGNELGAVFSSTINITPAYYLGIYPRHRRLIAAMTDSGLAYSLFPSIYYCGCR